MENFLKIIKQVYPSIRDLKATRTFWQNEENLFQNQIIAISTALESTICEICDTEFPTAMRLKNHTSSVHETPKCPFCNQNFSSGSISKHILNVHGKEEDIGTAHC